MAKSPYDELPGNKEEINQVIQAAHALEIDSPIIHYRIVGDRIELWTAHGGPYSYPPEETPDPGVSTEQPAKRPARRKR